MKDTLKKTIYISSKKLSKEINFCKEFTYNGLYVGYGSDLQKINEKCESLIISFEKGCIEADSIPKNNFIMIGKDNLVIVGSDMNTQAIFYINIPEKGIFAVFNDLFIAKDILQGIGLEVEYDVEKNGENLTFFKYVSRLKHGEKIEVHYNNNNLKVEKNLQSDILLQPSCSMALDKAKERFYEVLFNATKELTKWDEEICISLSGGIDSGTIAYILKKLNKKVCAYTLGTDWGNEYKEAQETADFLGINLIKIHLSNEEILREVPNVIRYFAFKDVVPIEVALVAVSLYQKLYKEIGKKMTFVTGYGSDLLNAGIYSNFNYYSELEDQIANGLRKTQISNEFSNLFALNVGIKTIHPFWHSDVIKEALKIPVEYKVKDGKDKYFFRSMMEGRLPASVAWRTKKGAHQGTGLSTYLKGALESSFCNNYDNQNDYQSIIKSIHKDIFLQGKYPWK
ncbi:asparagine synthase C-terminal domain-containing protein [Pelosinus fermentans]|uniref:asparagine synthase (glutamine-hydrolyzing) n=1 Tax=Pelosinus fermentans JBW45 TaxID=1192197 RepID=I9DGL5_9FIRM|nr:asparagine synthase C-terminal domain-containing protein [Pelosinus fermentans]AJQ26592.1 asparagine synthase [Pelosinus fermentans JBW45]